MGKHEKLIYILFGTLLLSLAFVAVILAPTHDLNKSKETLTQLYESEEATGLNLGDSIDEPVCQKIIQASYKKKQLQYEVRIAFLIALFLTLSALVFFVHAWKEPFDIDSATYTYCLAATFVLGLLGAGFGAWLEIKFGGPKPGYIGAFLVALLASCSWAYISHQYIHQTNDKRLWKILLGAAIAATFIGTAWMGGYYGLGEDCIPGLLQ